MNIYKVLSVLVVFGVLSVGGGILLGVSASANYLVEVGAALFAAAATFFVARVLSGLWREFKETA
jgi:hypothetical protein